MECGATTGETKRTSSMAQVIAPASAQTLLLQGAHEIRNQLAIILLQLGQVSNEAARQIEAEVRTLNQTVERLALLGSLSTSTGLRMDEFDLAGVVSRVIAQVEGKQRMRSVHVEHVDLGGGPVRAHGGAIAEAIACLLENAFRHAPAARRICVTSGAGPVVVVEDDGAGMPRRPLAELAAPFVTGGTAAAGAGLGLAIVSAVARLHGGGLQSMPSPLGGARLELRLSASDNVA